MHLDHDAIHRHDHAHDHAAGHGLSGHNRAARPAQWQTPHRRPDEPASGAQAGPEAADLDLVAVSFAEGFSRCSDPTSFLRLAGVPFIGTDATGRRLHLLRIELKDLTDVGSIVPLLGGQGMRYAPLPGRLASRRRQVRFVYHDGAELVSLDFAAARALSDRSDSPVP
jgi:hypothetical protein